MDLDLPSLSSSLPRDSILPFRGTLASLHKSSVVVVAKTSVMPLSFCPRTDHPRDRKNEVIPQEHLSVPRKNPGSVRDTSHKSSDTIANAGGLGFSSALLIPTQAAVISALRQCPDPRPDPVTGTPIHSPLPKSPTRGFSS